MNTYRVQYGQYRLYRYRAVRGYRSCITITSRKGVSINANSSENTNLPFFRHQEKLVHTTEEFNAKMRY